MFEELTFQTSLGSDNHTGVHPKVMQALMDANHGHAHAYGMDELCQLTQQEFTRVFGHEVEAHYVFTGTAANVLCLAPLLKSFEAVICSDIAHLHLDECGAPEKYLGAKLWPLAHQDGKIFSIQTADLLCRGGDQHFSQSRAISLTQPTEVGTCYTIDELRAWRDFTRNKGLFLHLDGARLVNAAAFLNVSLKELTSDLGVDVVSFGGTKNGLMGAEACLLFSKEAKQSFKFYRKQAMQLSSKTRFLAAQFYAFLKDDLWLTIARHSINQAQKLAEALKPFEEIRLRYRVQSNAVFVDIPKPWLSPLRKKFFFYIWQPGEDTSLCRWMTGFDWTDELTTQLVATIQEVKTCFPAK